MKTIWFIFSQIALISAAFGNPQPDTLHFSNKNYLEVGSEMVFITDSTNRLSANQILTKFRQGGGSKPLGPNPNFGISNSTYWTYLVIHNSGKTNIDAFIHIDNFLMDTTRCFEINQVDSLALIGTAGDYLPFATRPVINRHFVYPINLKPYQNKSYLVSVYKDHSSISLPIKIWPQHKFYQNDTNETILYGLYFGVLLLVLVYSLFLYVSSKKILLLYYFLYVFLLALFQLNHLGFAQQYLWPNSWFMPNFGFWIVGVLMTVFFILFALHFTQIKHTQPILDFYFKIIAVVLIGFALGILLFSGSLHEYTSFAKKLYYYIQLSSAIGFVLLVFFILKTGSTEGKYFSLAFSALLGFGVVYLLREMGWIDYNGFTQNALIIGSLIEVLIFSLGITHIVSKAFVDRQILLEKLQKQQEELLLTTIETEEKERLRISSELHDSVGSQLSFLKVSLEHPSWFKNKQKLEDQVDDIADTVRKISHNMTPIVLEMEGLKVAISNLVEKINQSSDTKFHLEWLDMPNNLPNLKAVTLYRVVQEALTNIVRHSQANDAYLNFTGYPNEIVIMVEDDGNGFDSKVLNGIGLKTMKNRVQQLKGKFDISSALGNGTSIVVTFPV